MKFERTLGKLTERQLDVFRSLQHCLNAARTCLHMANELHESGKCTMLSVKSFTQQVLFELEDRKKMEYRIYEKLAKEYELTEDEFLRLDINPDSGNVKILDKDYFAKSQDGRMDIRKLDLIWRT